MKQHPVKLIMALAACIASAAMFLLPQRGTEIISVQLGACATAGMITAYSSRNITGKTDFILFVASIFLMAHFATGYYYAKMPLLYMGTCAAVFLLPVTMIQAFVHLSSIPEDQYEPWRLPDEAALPSGVSINGISVTFIIKTAAEASTPSLSIKASESMSLGRAFSLLARSEEFKDATTKGVRFGPNPPAGWLFYRYAHLGLSRKFLDPRLSLKENNVTKNTIIYSEAVPFSAARKIKTIQHEPSELR